MFKEGPQVRYFSKMHPHITEKENLYGAQPHGENVGGNIYWEFPRKEAPKCQYAFN